MLARKVAETFIFALIGALIIPTVTMWLSSRIATAMENTYSVPAIVTVIVASIVLPFIMKAVLSLFMTISMTHVAVALAIFVIQIPVCGLFFLLGGLPLYLAVSVLAGSFVSLVITIILRPFTLATEIGKGIVKGIKGDSEKRD